MALAQPVEAAVERVGCTAGASEFAEIGDHRHGLIVSSASKPDRAGSTLLQSHPGVRASPARLGRDRVEPEHRVGSPRHIVLFRLAPDGIVDILSVIPDRMLLSRAAERAGRAANS